MHHFISCVFFVVQSKICAINFKCQELSFFYSPWPDSDTPIAILAIVPVASTIPSAVASSKASSAEPWTVEA